VLPLDVQRAPIDFLAADGHKWLLGPEGAGVFFIRRELIERLRPVSVGWHSVVGAWNFSTIDFTLKPDAGRWENGTLNLGGIVSLGASVELLLEIGIDLIGKRVLELTDHFCDRARSAGLEIFSSRQDKDRSGIVSLTVPGLEPREAVKRCRAEGIAINARAGRVRVSPHFYNTTSELDRVIASLTRQDS
jgi:selenocysteine lyase/cysteine desulfurase